MLGEDEINKVNELLRQNWGLERNSAGIVAAKCDDGNLYRPPSGNLKKAMEQLSKCIESIDREKREVFLISDLNVNLKNKLSADYKNIDLY